MPHRPERCDPESLVSGPGQLDDQAFERAAGPSG